jgi:hypothetical protein
VWRRSIEECVERKLPNITRVASRFTGEWKHDIGPEEALEPSDDYERIALEHHQKN